MCGARAWQQHHETQARGFHRQETEATGHSGACVSQDTTVSIFARLPGLAPPAAAGFQHGVKPTAVRPPF